jgi:hypothetical protein
MASRFRFWLLILIACVNACAAPQQRIGDVNYFVVGTRSHAVVRASLSVPARYVLPNPPLFYMKTSYGATSTWKVASVSRRGDGATIVVEPTRSEATPKLGDLLLTYFYEGPKNDPIVLPNSEVLPPHPRQQVPPPPLPGLPFTAPVPVVLD